MYIYEGSVIKLNERDYEEWRGIYPNIDLDYHLDQIDIEFRDRQRQGRNISNWY